MSLKKPKLSIVGAAGNVGAAVVQWCMQKELADLTLIDLKDKVAQGRAQDLSQAGAYGGFATKFESTSDYSALQGSDVVVVTAGIPRKPGQTREELVGVNAAIVKDICEKVKAYAPESILIVVSNPLDAMLTVALHVTGFPRERVLGMSGVLDSSRFRANIAHALGVHIKDVSAMVLGAHTDKDMVPVVSAATVGGIPLTNLLDAAMLEDIVSKTKRGGAELTELIGTSAWVAPGLGVTAMVESVLLDQRRVLPCSVALQGEFGISDACLCVPVLLSGRGAERVFEFPLSFQEQEAFQAAYRAYLEVKRLALSNV